MNTLNRHAAAAASIGASVLLVLALNSCPAQETTAVPHGLEGKWDRGNGHMIEFRPDGTFEMDSNLEGKLSGTFTRLAESQFSLSFEIRGIATVLTYEYSIEGNNMRARSVALESPYSKHTDKDSPYIGEKTELWTRAD
jgi:hypothetical protein